MTQLIWGCLDTPVGLVSVGCSATGVARVSYGPPPPAAPGGAPVPADAAGTVLAAALAELDGYFAGQAKAFGVPVDLPAAAGARRTVLSALHGSVGYGQTVTYGALAARAGLDGQAGGTAMPPARVVGQIMASNPIALIVPCHRVVAGDGLGGYSGGTGTDVKRWLLVFEGAIPPTLDWDPAGVRPRHQPAGA